MTRIPTRTVEQHDDYFGTSVPDPYRWLEDTDDPEVVEWLSAQASATRAYLDALPGRAAITTALQRAVSVPHSGLPVHRGGRWFRTDNDGVQQQDVLVVSAEPFGEPRVLIDPTPRSDDASTSLAEWRPSPDGTLIAYSYSEAGSDWRTWRVREVATGRDLPDVLRWSKFCVPTWLPDGSALLYLQHDAPDSDEFVASTGAERLTLHRLGTSQDDDEIVLARPDEPDVIFEAHVAHDERWLIVLGFRGTDVRPRVWVRDLTHVGGELRLLIADETATWTLLDADGDELLMITDLDAPRSRVVALSTVDASVRELVAERPDSLEGGIAAGGQLVLRWLRDAASRLTVHARDGREQFSVALPGIGSITELSGRVGEPLVHLGWTSFSAPPSVLCLDTGDGTLRTAFSAPLDSELVTEQIRVTSKDGTEVPVFLVHRPEVTPGTGPHPSWLYGYGGFRISMTPSFEPTRFAFAEAGGVAAIACLRGGGEYGAPWHDGGRLANKQHVFDDAIATAERLIATGWTDAAHLAASGRSNGGLLAGALLTQRPDLFAAVVPEVGVLDLLRFPRWTIGWAWVSDYGDPRADAEQFAIVHAYSPLHNLRAGGGYPPVLVLTSDHDDRVVPAHSIKFAAQLQAVSPDRAIALLRVEAAGGHKEGRSRTALVAERADVLAFICRHTGLDWE